tara:strand:+ start:9 stop:818 length:810 start_codon:yes stop_codon:yes gene_type:complete
MFNILFAKTFFLVSIMLIITSVTTRINKDYETPKEAIFTFLGSFVFLFAVTYFSEIFPLNILMVCCFSAIIGWSLGPTITSIGRRFKYKRFLKKRNILTKKDSEDKEIVTYTKNDKGEMHIIKGEELESLLQEFEKEIEKGGDPYNKKWQNIVFQAMLGTALAVLLTAILVFFTSIDFSFLGIFLFMSLILLIVFQLLNAFIFKSPLLSLLKAYFGLIIFILYLVYDFNRLESMIAQGDTSWSTAIDIAVNLYLDIINLFLDLLEILAE